MAQLCELYHVLPEAGGILDQDPWNVAILKAYQHSLAERREFERRRKPHK